MVVNLLVKPLWILMIDRTVQNRVGHAEYGTYQALVNLSLIFNIVLDFGLTYYNTKTISGAPGKLRTLFPAVLSARLLLAAIYGIIIISAGVLAGYNSREILLLSGILVIQSLNSLMLFLRSNVSALQKFRLDALLSVSDKLMMIVLCSVLLFVPAISVNFKIEWFVLAQITCYVLAAIISMWVLRKMASLSFKLSFNLQEVSSIIKKSLPYATLIFLTTVHMRTDTILVERLSGVDSKEYAGIYAAGYRLLDVCNMFGIMFAGMLLPMFGKMLSKETDITPIVRLSANILLPVAFMITISAAFFGTDIMQLLYDDTDAYSGKVFAWLMACFPAYCIMYIYSTLLTANGNMQLLNKVAIAGVLINLPLNLWLIPQGQALAAAQVAFATQGTMAILYIFFSGKKLQLPKSPKWVGAYVFYLILLATAAYLYRQLPMQWLYQLVLFVGTSAILVFLFRFISIKSVKTFLEKKG